jgi:hypothetical protein
MSVPRSSSPAPESSYIIGQTLNIDGGMYMS